MTESISFPGNYCKASHTPPSYGDKTLWCDIISCSWCNFSQITVTGYWQSLIWLHDGIKEEPSFSFMHYWNLIDQFSSTFPWHLSL